MAVRVPVAEAFALYAKGAERIVAVSDDEVAEAMRIYYSDTHNCLLYTSDAADE